MAAFPRRRSAMILPTSFKITYTNGIFVVLFNLILISPSVALLVGHPCRVPCGLDWNQPCLNSRFPCKMNTEDSVGGIRAIIYYSKGLTTTNMLRNIDLPECIVFYGMETVIYEDKGNVDFHPGFLRFLQESQDIESATLLLSEHKTTLQMKSVLVECCSTDSQKLSSPPLSMLELRSSLSLPTIMDNKSNLVLVGKGYSPSPAALLDSISSVNITPKGFGGSGGFGIKHADPLRCPLPKHCVVFVTGPSTTSRARCAAARAAGMRIIYIERRGTGTCDCEDLVDGVISGFVDDTTETVLTIDDIATPGSFWLNPPSPRDENGNHVDPYNLVDWFYKERCSTPSNLSGHQLKTSDESAPLEKENKSIQGDPEEELLNAILADLDPL